MLKLAEKPLNYIKFEITRKVVALSGEELDNLYLVSPKASNTSCRSLQMSNTEKTVGYLQNGLFRPYINGRQIRVKMK